MEKKMGNKKSRSNTQFQNIVTDSVGIVCLETKVDISDEKLKGLLMRAYESARKDARAFRVSKLYGILLSIAGTLFLTLLTADFKDVLGMESSVITTIAWLICAFCFVVGMIFCIVNSNKSSEDEIDGRNKTVQEILSDIEKYRVYNNEE